MFNTLIVEYNKAENKGYLGTRGEKGCNQKKDLYLYVNENHIEI